MIHTLLSMMAAAAGPMNEFQYTNIVSATRWFLSNYLAAMTDPRSGRAESSQVLLDIQINTRTDF